MQQIITKDLLAGMGIKLEGAEMDALVEQSNATLQERIGAEITLSLDDEKLQELIKLQTSNPDAVEKWLTDNIPELTEIIEDERDILLGEIVENTDTLNAEQ
jgi:hypothetical protein